jgi:Pyrimidine dimer DNA glycosylase
MQTFVPYGSSFRSNAKVLDDKRLRKQGVECYQILRANRGLTKGWVNHPATRMWAGHEQSLVSYTREIYREIIKRGFNGQLWGTIEDEFYDDSIREVTPYWLGDTRVQITHRGRLYEKDPEFYDLFVPWADYRGQVCCERCNYYWPTHRGNKDYRWGAP